VLSSTLVTFSWSDADARLRADRPIIDLDPNGHIREVRFNNRSVTMPILSQAQTRVFHTAYRRLAAIIARPALQIWFRLDPGDCLIMDNTRVQHARSAFADTAQATAARHLQGCYADLDGLISTLATIEAAR